MGLFLIKKGKQMHSLALEADGKHLLSDALTSVGLILGLMVIKLTNYTYADGFLAMIFGLFIVKMGLELLLKSFDGLMDTASPETLKNITDAVVQNRKQNWVGFHDLKVLKAGNAYFVSYHLVLPWYFSLRETKNETDQINDLVSSLLGKKVEFSEHTEGCEKHFCKNCPLSCAHREEDFIEWLTWQHEHMIQAGVPAVK
jgi:cation diffusion facilitator family transporter